MLSKYIFIGSGSLGISGGNPYYAFYRNLGRIAIPGSSIKGAVRCLLEAVSYSCPGVIKGHSASALRDRGIYQCSSRENRKGDLCAACGIFGTVGYGGRASFRDAFPIGEAVVRLIKIGDLFPPRIERDRKFYVHKDFNAEDTQPESQTRFIEAVSGDTAFLCRMDFENLTRAELSLLFHTMGIGRDHYLKLGGAKPRCLGTVTFEPRELMLRSRKDLFKEGRSVEENTMQTCSRIMDDVSLLNKQALERYKREFCHQGEACPRRLY